MARKSSTKVEKEPDTDEQASIENKGAVKSDHGKRKGSDAGEEHEEEAEEEGDATTGRHIKKLKADAKASPQKQRNGAHGEVKSEETPTFLQFLEPNLEQTVGKALQEIYPLGDGFEETPINALLRAMAASPLQLDQFRSTGPIFYRFNMHDLRIKDNRGLALAAHVAQQTKQPLVTVFIFSPGDYKAHDRAPIRIDFVLRNLQYLQDQLASRHIPLFTATCNERKKMGPFVHTLLKKYNATLFFGNIEYEIDEARRDLQTVETLRAAGQQAIFVHDNCVVPPGRLSSGKGMPYGVYSPYKRAWIDRSPVSAPHMQIAPLPAPNDASVRRHRLLADLFAHAIPTTLDGFAFGDREHMTALWPAGTHVAEQMLVRFMTTLAEASIIDTETAPLSQGKSGDPKKTRIALYGDQRSRLDIDGSSRLSPYLAAGCISARVCVRAAAKCSGDKIMDARSGPSMWIQEVIWRDFYVQVLAAHPHVSMGLSYKRDYDAIVWEYDKQIFKQWCEGRTGVPIVDAGMRQLRAMGWCHNRVRMIVAMYLVKHLMTDWRWGEKFFSENLIDGDLAANNGGWQWVAGSGTDPAPYFRIFAPHTQSEKCDPNGDYIRRFVPELKHIKGKAIHAPHERLDAQAFQQLNYPKPLVDHKWARERCLRRFKNPGSE